MGKKKRKKKFEEQRVAAPPARAMLKATVILVYFATIVLFVFFLREHELVMYAGHGPARPSAYLFVVWGLYYVAPVALAAVFGILFRPAFRNFRDVLFPIFYIAVIYSFGITMIRGHYADKRFEDISRTRLARVRMGSVTHTVNVDSRYGLLESVDFTVKFGMEGFPAGKYRAVAVVAADDAGHPEKSFGSFDFPVKTGQGDRITGHFRLDLLDEPSLKKRGDFDISLILQRLLSVDKDGRRILAFSRWTPFFRTCDWDGNDPGIREETLTLEVFRYIDYVVLPHSP